MDEYLVPVAAFERLLNEYKRYGSIVVAYDFDNTVYDFHKKGATYDNVIQLLRNLKEINCTIICFTANEDSDFVKGYCAANNIPLDLLNENPAFFKSTSKKIYFNALLDDRAGLIQVFNELTQLYNQVKSKT